MFNDNWCGSENVIYVHSMGGMPQIIRQYHLDVVIQHNFVPAVKIGEMFTPSKQISAGNNPKELWERKIKIGKRMPVIV